MIVNKANDKRYYERGATALIIVVFSILLLMTISVSFMRLVVQDQKNTNDNELSRGAYDSALAGVEDGKRVLQACLGNGNTTACSAIANNCNTIHAAKILSATDDASNTDEVMIQNSTGTTGGFDQAYTCVKIDRNTDDYQGSLNNNTSSVVPMNTTGSFTQVKISWYKSAGPTANYDLNNDITPSLPPFLSWSAPLKVRPALLRVQLAQFNKAQFKMQDFDQSADSGTLYLYPSSVGTVTSSFAIDARGSKANSLLVPVKCSTSLQYVCSVTLNLPLPVGTTNANQRQAYLRLTSFYGDTDFIIEPVGTQFEDVEPAIDATGRASDVYRRVRSRVQLVSPVESQLFPRATVDLTRNFCKDFAISDVDYMAGTCRYDQP